MLSVSFSLPADLLPAEADPATLAVQHLAEDEDGAVQDVVTVADVADETAGTVTVETGAAALSLEEDAAALPADAEVKAEFEVDGFSVLAVTYNSNTRSISGPQVVYVGESIVLTSSHRRAFNDWRFSSEDGGQVVITDVVSSLTQTNTATITGVYPGTVTITHEYGVLGDTETFQLTVSDEGYINVYVYVASQDSEGNSWYGNEEFLDLIGLHVADEKNYFPAGKIQLPRSILNGKTNVATAGAALLNTESDWATVISALAGIQTDEELFTTGYALNANNSVGDYNSQAAQDTGYGWDTQHSALFRWNDGEEHRGFNDNTGTVKYHLDLCFNTNRITFITGNNGIDTGDAKDDTEIDSRVYITGSEVQPPRNLNIPEGYKFTGYFEDKDFNTEWTGIYQPLYEDKTVYIRIEPLQNAVIYYEVLPETGAGTLDSSYESFSPDGTPQGSTATAVSGYKFVGWHYYDTDTEKYVLVTPNAKLNPQPNDMNTSQTAWQEGEERTYYAIFEPDTTDVTITKTFSGLPEDLWDNAAATIDFTVKQGDEVISDDIGLVRTGETYTATIEDLTINSSYEIVENTTELADYNLTKVEVGEEDVTTTKSTTITVEEDNNEITFTNTYTRSTGTLVLDKVIGGLSDTDLNSIDDLYVTATITGPADAAGVEVTNLNGTASFAPTQDGQHATVEVYFKANAGTGTDFTISDLPTGTYKVEENLESVSDIGGGKFYFDNAVSSGVAEVSVGKDTAATATITNNYKPYISLVVDKLVSGEMGSLSDWFTFTATIKRNDEVLTPTMSTGGDGKSSVNAEKGEFYLQSGGAVTLGSIKEDDQIVIRENGATANGYEITIDSRNLQVTPTQEAPITINNADGSITFIVPADSDGDLGKITYNNYRAPVAPTGLESNHTTPYVLMITAAGMAGLALIGGIVARRIRRRRQE